MSRDGNGRVAKLAVLVVGVALVLGVALSAQTPAPAPPGPGGSPAPGAAAPGRAGAPGPQAPGGGGPGRGPLDGVDLSPRPPVGALTPTEQQKLFEVRPGYTISPVLSDPHIQQPGTIAFDGNGRMYVLELRTYMLDADATAELAPRNRISRWEDRNNDGIYETGTVFIDNMIFPRFITPIGDGVVIAKEANSNDTYIYTDTNDDGRADKKELWVTGLGRFGNVEGQEGQLTWTLDNWMYSTYNSLRVRWTPNGVLKETIPVAGSQWGLSQDNYGKIWFQRGSHGLPSYFQFPILYGHIINPQAIEDGFSTPWGAPIYTADMQGGRGNIRPDGSLTAVTAGSGANIYRGDRLPSELVGEYFYGEVVGRVLRRVHPANLEGLTQAQNPYQAEKTEFIRSTDPLFRPVDNKTAPDGTIYVVDMYNGIIQQAEWTRPGSYLRAKIEQYALDKVTGHGRIWRVSHTGIERDRTQPRMYQDPSARLVTYLAHPNGWWRDMAQQQLIIRQDRRVVNALKTMARSNANHLGRIHALWTLEGLGSLDADLVRAFTTDADPRVRVQGVRVSEILYKGGDRSFEADYRTLANDPAVDVSLQALLTMNLLKVPNTADTAKAVQAARPGKGIDLVVKHIVSPSTGAVDFAGYNMGDSQIYRTETEVALLARGAQIFEQNCTECHGQAGEGTPNGMGGLLAPALAGNTRLTQNSPEEVLRVLLSGLTGPIDGRSYTGAIMVPQRIQSDDWIAAVASYLRNGMTGNNANLIAPDMVARIRAEEANRTVPYTEPQLKRAVPQLLPYADTWKVTASHSAPVRIGGTAQPSGAFTLEGWVTGEEQKPGMWFQVELPRTVSLAGLDYQALLGANAGRGRGGAPGPARPTYFPRGYTLEVSTDGKAWTAIQQSASASTMYQNVMLAPVQVKFLRFTLTEGAAGVQWGMRYLKLFTKSA